MRVLGSGADARQGAGAESSPPRSQRYPSTLSLKARQTTAFWWPLYSLLISPVSTHHSLARLSEEAGTESGQRSAMCRLTLYAAFYHNSSLALLKRAVGAGDRELCRAHGSGLCEVSMAPERSHCDSPPVLAGLSAFSPRTNHRRKEHPACLKRSPAAARARRELAACAAGAGLGACSSPALMHGGLAVSQPEKLVGPGLVPGPGRGHAKRCLTCDDVLGVPGEGAVPHPAPRCFPWVIALNAQLCHQREV